MNYNDLSNEDMILLYQKTQDEFLFNEIYNKNKRIVTAIVRKMNEIDTVKFSYEDLEQLGNVGLWRAINSYDPTRGAFSTIAYKAVKNEIYRSHKTTFANKNRVKTKFYHISIDEKLSDNIDGLSYNDIISYEHDFYTPSVNNIVNQYTMDAIKLIRATLNDKENEIVDMLVEGKTQEQIGEYYGVTRQNINAKVKSIRKKMNKLMCEFDN